MEPFIDLKDIHLAYGTKVLLQSYNLSINKGEKVLIKGPSGVGKTSILKLVLGFVRPQSGEVRIQGQLVDENSIWELRKVMAYVSQELEVGQGLVGDFIDEVLEYASNKHLSVSKTDKINLLEQFGLSGSVLEENLSQLSGGEKQRVAIVIAIMLDKDIYLLDEITAALDVDLKERVVQFFLNWKDKTVVSVSHDSVWLGTGFRVVDMGK